MINSFPILVFVFAALAVPTVIHAQSAGRICDSPTYCASRLPGGHPFDGAGARMARFAVAISDPRAARSRPYAYADAAFPPAHAQLRTAVDYRFAPEGLVGSVGYTALAAGRPLDFDDSGLAASVGFLRPDGLVGAWLHYHFR